MTSPLAAIFSTIESVKRRAADMLANPGQTYKNNVNAANTAAGEHLQALRATIDPQGNPNPAAVDKATQDLVNFGSNFNMAGILAGPRAKGINNIALAMAMKDQRKGRPGAEIWAEHGWGKGPDGFWRTEIDDNMSQLNMLPLPVKGMEPGSYIEMGKGGPMGPLQYSFQHPGFARAYPEIWQNSNATLSIDSRIKPGQSRGSFSRFGHRGDGVPVPGGDISAMAGNPFELKNTVLHELQHAVQRQEGFAGGGAPSMFRTNDPGEAFRLYQRLGGEAESRLVEARRAMLPQQRRAAFPFDPEIFRAQSGVPIDSLILQPAP